MGWRRVVGTGGNANLNAVLVDAVVIRLYSLLQPETALALYFLLVISTHRKSKRRRQNIVVQVYEPGKGLAFHFDKDEHAMKEKNQMLQPVLSSVLYLTGDHTTQRLGRQIRSSSCFLHAQCCTR